MFQERLDLVRPAVGHVLCQTADARVTRRKAGPANVLENIVDQFAIVEPIQERRERPKIQCSRSHTEQVILNTGQFRDDRPKDFAPRRNFDAEQLLASVVPNNVVGHRADVVHAVRHHDILVVVQVLAELLEAAVQIPNVRRAADDRLAVQLQHQAQRRMRRRMLRAKVQRPKIVAKLIRNELCRLETSLCLRHFRSQL